MPPQEPRASLPPQHRSDQLPAPRRPRPQQTCCPADSLPAPIVAAALPQHHHGYQRRPPGQPAPLPTEPLRDRVLDRASAALAVGGPVGVRIVMNMSTGLPGNPSGPIVTLVT